MAGQKTLVSYQVRDLFDQECKRLGSINKFALYHGLEPSNVYAYSRKDRGATVPLSIASALGLRKVVRWEFV